MFSVAESAIAIIADSRKRGLKAAALHRYAISVTGAPAVAIIVQYHLLVRAQGLMIHTCPLGHAQATSIGRPHHARMPLT